MDVQLNLLKTVEPYTSNEWTIQYVNYTSKKLWKKSKRKSLWEPLKYKITGFRIYLFLSYRKKSEFPDIWVVLTRRQKRLVEELGENT